MKKCGLGLLGLTLTSVVAIASANAADIYRAPEGVGGYKDSYVPVATWTGFYVGVNGGYGWNAGNSKVNTTVTESFENISGTDTRSLDSSGGFAGGQLGYNAQQGRFVYGIEADFQGAGIDGKRTATAINPEPGSFDGPAPVSSSAKSSLDWFGTVRARLGYTFDRTLVYATGGFAFGGVKDKLGVVGLSPDLPASPPTDCTVCTAGSKRDQTATGFVVGGGLEYALTPAWSLKGEYQYIDLGRTTLAANTGTADCCDVFSGSVSIDHTYHTVRVGLNYHVGQGYEPLK